MRWQAPVALLVLALGVAYAWWSSTDVTNIEVEPATTIDDRTKIPSPHEDQRAAGAAEQTNKLVRTEVAIAAGAATWRVAGTTRRGWKAVYPIAAVRIELFDGYTIDGKPFATRLATSDAKGSFEVGFPAPERTVTIRARPDMEDVRPTSTKRTIVFNARPPTDLRVRIFPLDRTLHGRVVDELGEGLAGSRIQIRYHEPSRPCADDGTFELRVSSVESLTLRASAPGYAMNKKRVTLPAKGDPDPITITLQPGLTIRGRVVDGADQPIANADVTTFMTSYYTHVFTDEHGEFVLDYLHRGRGSHSLFARKAGYIAARTEIETAKQKDAYELVLRRGTRIEGFVIDATGDPLPGAPLYIGSSSSDYDRLDAIAKDDGRFVFPVVAAGEHDLVVEMPGHASKKMKLVVPKSTPVLQGVAVQLEAAHFVSGVVKDEQGNPLSGIGIHARLANVGTRAGMRASDDRYIGESTKSNEAGEFRIEDLPGGKVGIEFYGRAILRHVERSVQVDRTDLEIKLQRAARLAGRVLAADTKQPITKFRIKFLETSTGGYSASWSRGHEIQSEDGRWLTDTDQLKPGAEFVVEAAAKGFGRVIKKMRAAIDPEADANVFELAPGQTIRGTVVSRRSGRPVRGARVILYSALDPIRRHSGRDMETRLTATTDAEGAFTLRDVPLEERIFLSIEHKEFPIAIDGPLEVPRGVGTNRRILLESSARITGTIVDAAGSPIVNAEIQLLITSPRLQEHVNRRTRSDARGAFEFAAGLPSGTCSIRRRAHNDDRAGPFTLCTTEFELEPGAEKTIRLEPAGTCSAVGTIRWADARPAPQILNMHFTRKRGAGARLSYYRVQARDGKFDVRGLPEGTYDVGGSVYIGGTIWSVSRRGLEIKPGKPEHVVLTLTK